MSKANIVEGSAAAERWKNTVDPLMSLKNKLQ